MTTDTGLLAVRALDHALRLTEMADERLSDLRTGRNVRHQLAGLLRQSVYARLAGHEDVNGQESLTRDPAMRAAAGRKALERNAASSQTVSRFETEILAREQNISALSWINTAWVERAMAASKVKEGKYALSWTRLSCTRFASNRVRLALFVLACNLGNFMRRFALPGEISHWSLRSVQFELIKIGAGVAKHSRRTVFQCAEVSVSAAQFAEMLCRIRLLAAAPA